MVSAGEGKPEARVMGTATAAAVVGQRSATSAQGCFSLDENSRLLGEIRVTGGHQNRTEPTKPTNERILNAYSREGGSGGGERDAASSNVPAKM